MHVAEMEQSGLVRWPRVVQYRGLRLCLFTLVLCARARATTEKKREKRKKTMKSLHCYIPCSPTTKSRRKRQSALTGENKCSCCSALKEENKCSSFFPSGNHSAFKKENKTQCYLSLQTIQLSKKRIKCSTISLCKPFSFQKREDNVSLLLCKLRTSSSARSQKKSGRLVSSCAQHRLMTSATLSGRLSGRSGLLPSLT